MQVSQLESEGHNTVIRTNLTSAFVLSQAVYPEFLTAGGGKIINVASILAIFGASFAAPYAASKAGLVQLSKVLATAWAADHIQVNAVLPGWIDTELTVGARRALPGLHARVLARTPAVKQRFTDGIAMLMQEEAVFGAVFDKGRFDVGKPIDHLKATVELAYDRPDLAPEFRAFLADFVKSRGLV